jgi:hypothetical protein
VTSVMVMLFIPRGARRPIMTIVMRQVTIKAAFRSMRLYPLFPQAVYVSASAVEVHLVPAALLESHCLVLRAMFSVTFVDLTLDFPVAQARQGRRLLPQGLCSLLPRR